MERLSINQTIPATIILSFIAAAFLSSCKGPGFSNKAYLVLNGVKKDIIQVESPYQLRLSPVLTGGKIKDREIAATAWYIDRELFSTDPVFVHTFKKPGQYEIVCAVRNGDGLVFYKRVIVSVRENAPPECELIVQNDSPKVKEMVIFDAVCNDPDGKITRYWFDYGDGMASASNRHRYNEEGTYIVTLKATDNKGASTFVQRQIVVSR